MMPPKQKERLPRRKTLHGIAIGHTLYIGLYFIAQRWGNWCFYRLHYQKFWGGCCGPA